MSKPKDRWHALAAMQEREAREGIGTPSTVATAPPPAIGSAEVKEIKRGETTESITEETIEPQYIEAGVISVGGEARGLRRTVESLRVNPNEDTGEILRGNDRSKIKKILKRRVFSEDRDEVELLVVTQHDELMEDGITRKIARAQNLHVTKETVEAAGLPGSFTKEEALKLATIIGVLAISSDKTPGKEFMDDVEFPKNLLDSFKPELREYIKNHVFMVELDKLPEPNKDTQIPTRKMTGFCPVKKETQRRPEE